MGSSASKQTLKTGSNAAKKTISLNRVQGTKGAIPKSGAVHSPVQGSGYSRPDGHDPQIVNEDGQNLAFAERLKKLGSVKFTDIQHQYSRTNEMLGAVQSRQKIEKQADELMQHQQSSPMDPKSLVHPETITAILQSRQEGDSDAKILEDFNLKPKVLESLGSRLSIPKIVKPTKEDHAETERQSVFRKEQVDETGPVLER
ncbi:hypothetical protein AWJ20_5188 [Sugiyamaella lignohabitans]|uniref:Uncharacterized protein n=1 Tax=Sugiyamaella lignohabitans TaxID=796027 RepID=A0A161HLJ3_9ASCO|nr:uncharacterized protein AWJ20_5188 [Sugiyamaella lignohabitans]ANB14227.1 hypothetical protein AWJ20_5188 [Sugiyamaella lignohabitans]